MLSQRTRHANRLRVTRGDNHCRQCASRRSNVFKHVIHTRVRLTGLPGTASDDPRGDRILRGQFTPRVKPRRRVPPFGRPCEIQGVAVPVSGDHADHTIHRPPLVDTHNRGPVMPVPIVNQVQPRTDTGAAVRRRQQDSRLGDRGTARGKKQHVRRHHHDVRVHVQLVKTLAYPIELILRAHGFTDHRNGDEQASRPCRRLNRLQRQHSAMKLVAAHNHADDPRTA